MNKATPSLVLYFISYILYLFFFKIIQDKETMLLFKPVILASITFYYINYSRVKKNSLHFAVLAICFLSDNMNLFGEDLFHEISIGLYLVMLFILLYLIVKDSKLIQKGSSLDKYFGVIIVVLVLLFVFSKLTSTYLLKTKIHHYYFILNYIVVFLSVLILSFYNLFKKKTEEIYNDDWYQIDEAVMTIVQRENPGIFELYYGDYQGIISNYTSPIHNMNLILRGAQKSIDANRTKDAYNMLCYCLQYFLDNPTSNLTNLYIEQHIIVDYYNNKKVLLEDVIRLIHLKMTSPNKSAKEEIHALLEKNKANINYYEMNN